jgi:hypothetical protein
MIVFDLFKSQDRGGNRMLRQMLSVLLAILMVGPGCRANQNSSQSLEDEPIIDLPKDPLTLGPRSREDLQKRTQERLKILKEIDQVEKEAQQQFGEHYGLMREFFAMMRSRVEGKRGEALFRIVPGWPGEGKSYVVNWMVDRLNLRSRLFSEPAHANLSHLPITQLEKSFVQPNELADANRELTLADFITIWFVDEAQNVDSTPVDRATLDAEMTEKLRVVNERAMALYPVIGDGSSEADQAASRSRNAYISTERTKLEKEQNERIEAYEQQAAPREHSNKVIRAMSSGAGIVEVSGGTPATDYADQIEEKLRLLLNRELENFPGHQLRERRELYLNYERAVKKTTDLQAQVLAAQSANDADGVRALQDELDASTKKVSELADKVREADGLFDAVEARLNSEIRANEEQQRNLTAELEATNENANNPQREQAAQRRSQIREQIQALKDQLKTKEEEKKANTERISARNSQQKQVLTLLEKAVRDYPEFRELVQDRIPDKYSPASAHYFLFEAFLESPKSMVEAFRARARRCEPGARRYAGNTIAIFAMNVPEIQAEHAALMEGRDINNPDENAAGARETVAKDEAPGGNKFFRKRIMKIFGGNPSDFDSLYSRVVGRKPYWFYPKTRAEFEAFSQVMTGNALMLTTNTLKSEGVNVQLEYDASVVDVVRRLGTSTTSGPRAMTNTPEFVLSRAKAKLQEETARLIAKGEIKRDSQRLYFHFSYDREANELVLRYRGATKIAAEELATIRPPRMTNLPTDKPNRIIFKDVIPEGDTAFVPGDLVGASQAGVAVRLRQYRTASMLYMGTLLFGSVPMGKDANRPNESAIELNLASEAETTKAIRTKWWPEPDASQIFWEYELYALLTRISATESDQIQKNGLTPEGEYAAREFERELPKLLELLERVAKDGLFVNESNKADLAKLFASVDKRMPKDPIFKALAETDRSNPDSVRKLAIELRLWVRTQLSQGMQPLRASMMGGNKGRIVDNLADELAKGQEMNPQQLVDFYSKNMGNKNLYKILPVNSIFSLIARRNITRVVIGENEAGRFVQTGCKVLRQRGWYDWVRDFWATATGRYRY